MTALTRRLTIDRNRAVYVEISLDLATLLKNGIPKGFEGTNNRRVKQAGIFPGGGYDSRSARA